MRLGDPPRGDESGVKSRFSRGVGEEIRGSGCLVGDWLHNNRTPPLAAEGRYSDAITNRGPLGIRHRGFVRRVPQPWRLV